MTDQPDHGADVQQPGEMSWDRTSDSEEEVSLRDLALVPYQRKRIVIACAALGLLTAILVTLTMTPVYKATATIELNENKAGGVSALSDLASAASGGADELKVKVQTEVAVIEDDSTALAVMSKLGMLHDAKPSFFSSHAGPVVSLDRLQPKQRESLIRAFESHLKVEEVESSRLLSITYTSKDPVEAARVANQVVVEYKANLLLSNFKSTKDVSQWLTDQLSGLSDQVTKSRQAVGDFEHSHDLASSMLGLASLGSGPTPMPGSGGTSGSGASSGAIHLPELDRLSSLSEELIQAEALRIESQAIYRLTETQNPDVISSIDSGAIPGTSSSAVVSQGNGLEVLNALREQQASAKVAYAEAATKYGAKNPRLVGISNQLSAIGEQIQLEMDRIRQRAKNALTLAQQNESSIRTALEEQKTVTSKMNDDVMQLGVLMEEARSSRELYDLLLARLQEANVDSGNSATNITLTDPARIPGKPFLPKPTLFPVFGATAGLFFGIGLAFLVESQDDTVRDTFAIETLTQVPALGVVPFHKYDLSESKVPEAMGGETSPFLLDPAGATAEAFRSLRSVLALSGVGRRLKLLSVTSSLGGEGKSFTVYNLALAFAATGIKVLIIDADLRRPKQHFLFRVPRQHGLSNVLGEATPFSTVLKLHPVASNLSLISAGEHTPLTSELLASGQIQTTLQIARDRFDLVLVDNAPVLPVADPIQVASYCDGTIGVARSAKTSRKALQRFAQVLRRNRIHLLGIVISAVEMSASEYRNVYGYNVESYYGDK